MNGPAKPVTGPISLISNLIHTTVDSTLVRHLSDPVDVDRSIFAKPRGVRWTDFDHTPEQQQGLFDAGHAAGVKWVHMHPSGPPTQVVGAPQARGLGRSGAGEDRVQKASGAATAVGQEHARLGELELDQQG